jgi:hypothetical protein
MSDKLIQMVFSYQEKCKIVKKSEYSLFQFWGCYLFFFGASQGGIKRLILLGKFSNFA